MPDLDVAEPESPEITELQRRLHDGVLQLLEFMSAGGWGSLSGDEEYRQLARRAADDLRATVEDDAVEGSLCTAIDHIVDGARMMDPGVHWVVDLDAQCHDMDAAPVEPLVRAIREAANNCVRHADATTVTISGTCVDESVVVDVRDDGRGFCVDSDHMGFGLRHSIIGRIERAGGFARIQSCDPHGTQVRLELAGGRRRRSCG